MLLLRRLQLARPGCPPRVRELGIASYRVFGLLILGNCLLAGCATEKEHKYTTHDVPAALLAEPWKPACNADLSSTVVRRAPRKIERGDTVEVVLASGLRTSEMT